MVELDVPAMVHVSASCNPNFHATGAHYINADTTAFMQFLTADLFKDFPALRFIIPHGGGARAVSLGPLSRPGAGHEAAAARRPDPQQRLLRHLRLSPGRASTCCSKIVPVDNILFGSEMVGAVRGIDPETGQYFDDTKRYVDAGAVARAPTDKQKIFEGNARKVFPRINKRLVGSGCSGLPVGRPRLDGYGVDHETDDRSKHPARRRRGHPHARRARRRHRARSAGAHRPDASVHAADLPDGEGRRAARSPSRARRATT